MFQAAKSLIKSNAATDLLKDASLSKAITNFRHTNAEQSGLTSVDKAFRHHTDSKAFNEAMSDKSKSLSESIAKTGEGTAKRARLEAQHKAIKDNVGLSASQFESKRSAALADAGKTRRAEASEAFKEPSRALRSGIKDYYTAGTAGQTAARVGATALAYGGAAVTARYISGGSAGVNNRGQRDIAGIPFI